MSIALTVLLASFVCGCNPDTEASVPAPLPPVVKPDEGGGAEDAGPSDGEQKPEGDAGGSEDSNGSAGSGDSEDTQEPPRADGKMRITIGATTFEVTLADNATAEAFRAQLPMTIDMDELHGNEKYYYLPIDLPSASYAPGMIQSGDLMLFGSNCLVLFYQTFSTSYRYTRIGHVDDPSTLAAALGNGRVEVSFVR